MTDGEALPAEMAADLWSAMSEVASGRAPARDATALQGLAGSVIYRNECIEAVRYIRAARRRY